MNARRRARSTIVLLLVAAAAAPLAGASPTASVPSWKAWLCFPGAPKDWCSVVLTTTVIGADGKKRVEHVAPASDPPVDCFYVYPTVSEQHRGNSTLQVTLEERDTAIIQAAQFSQVCRVYAPMYRQVTAYGNGNPYHGNYAYEYDDVLAAWRDYIAHDNDGRGVILIGHSEGAFLLEHIIESQIESSPAERKLLISAILLGGNVTVADGSTTGGTFKTTPACTSTTETGCVVAYSSWTHTPPGNAMFQSVSKPTQHVLCVNPAAPGSSAPAPITPIFPGLDPSGIAPYGSTYVGLLWVAFPDLYTATCVRQGHRAWLLVKRIDHPGDKRPTVTGVLAPNWGLHAADVNITLGDLLSLARSQSRSWLAHR